MWTPPCLAAFPWTRRRGEKTITTFSFLNENVDTATHSGLPVDEAVEVRKQQLQHLVSSLKMWTPPRLAAFMWMRRSR
jgi:hypothetical protein